MLKDLTRVPFFLFAESPEALQKLCFQNNATNDSMYDYNVISPTPADNRWGVWFLASAESYQSPTNKQAIDRRGVAHG